MKWILSKLEIKGKTIKISNIFLVINKISMKIVLKIIIILWFIKFDHFIYRNLQTGVIEVTLKIKRFRLKDFPIDNFFK